MLQLVLASALWAFSFGLIGSALRGVDVPSVVLLRLVLAWGLFLPFMRRATARLAPTHVFSLLGIGALQFGLMYVCYMSSYAYLEGHQVALMTAFTPLLVAGLCARRRTAGQLLIWGTACVFSLLGAAVTVKDWSLAGGSFRGIVLIQCSNLCFAVGQVLYRKLLPSVHATGVAVPDRQAFSIMYAGAVVVAAIWVWLGGHPESLVSLRGTQWLAVFYLGVVPAGLGFFLWNAGVRRATAGVVAVMNNLKVPLAVLFSLVLFHERAELWRVAAASTLVVGASLLVAYADRLWPERR